MFPREHAQRTQLQSADWAVIASNIHPDDRFYDGTTGVQLDGGKTYEFQLVAYEGSYPTAPPDDAPSYTMPPPSDDQFFS